MKLSDAVGSGDPKFVTEAVAVYAVPSYTLFPDVIVTVGVDSELTVKLIAGGTVKEVDVLTVQLVTVLTIPSIWLTEPLTVDPTFPLVESSTPLLFAAFKVIAVVPTVKSGANQVCWVLGVPLEMKAPVLIWPMKEDGVERVP